MNRHERRAQQKSAKASHELITTTFARAVDLHRAGDLPGAEELYRRVLGWSPASPEPWNFLGAIAFARGDMSKAEQRYAHALALKRDWPEALNAHGNCLHALGRFEEATRDIRRATEIDTGYHPAWNSLGISLQRTGEFAQAYDCFARACKLAPRTPRYLYNLGLNLKHQQRLAEAREAFAAALEPDATYRDALAQMAHCFRLEGHDESAAHWYRKYLELEPEDKAGARLFLAAHTGSGTLPAPSPAYIKQLFDGYAETFDDHLQQKLEYRLPEFLERVLRDWITARGRPIDVLDLGCGTGLVGARFTAHARTLVGVDLSGRMLERARERKIYAELVEADIGDYLRDGSERFDLVVAAEVFNYVGELGPVLAAVKPRLDAEGLLVFSVEAGLDPGLRLAQNLRFTHGEAYLREELERAGLAVVNMMREVLRRQNGQPVEGFIVLARVAADALRRG